ncbi:MAG: peroxiredoxin, partial [Acidobacteriota bacterium]
LIADLDQSVARAYGLVHPGESSTATVRALFVIDPSRTVRALIYYPLNVGRNVDEVIRLVDALQTASAHSVALPVDWRPGDSVVVPPPKTAADVEGRRESSDEVLTFYLHKRPLDAAPSA